MRGEATSAQIGGFLSRSGSRERRWTRSPAAPRPCASTSFRSSPPALTSWTRPGRAATGRIRSTSRLRPRSWPQPRVPAWPSMGTGRCRPPPARPTSSRRSVSCSSSTRRGSPGRSTSSASASCSLRRTIPPCATPLRCGASRHAHDFQRPRPAHESRPRPGADCRRLLRRPRADDRRRPRQPRCASRLRRARRRGNRRLSPAGVNLVYEVVDGELHKREIDPLDLGIERCGDEDLRGGAPAENAAMIRAVFAGEPGHDATRSSSTPRGRLQRRGTLPTSARASKARARPSIPAPRGPSGRAGRVLARGEGRLVGRFRDALAAPGLTRSPRSSGARRRRAISARTPTRSRSPPGSKAPVPPPSPSSWTSASGARSPISWTRGRPPTFLSWPRASSPPRKSSAC